LLGNRAGPNRTPDTIMVHGILVIDNDSGGDGIFVAQVFQRETINVPGDDSLRKEQTW